MPRGPAKPRCGGRFFASIGRHDPNRRQCAPLAALPAGVLRVSRKTLFMIFIRLMPVCRRAAIAVAASSIALSAAAQGLPPIFNSSAPDSGSTIQWNQTPSAAPGSSSGAATPAPGSTIRWSDESNNQGAPGTPPPSSASPPQPSAPGPTASTPTPTTLPPGTTITPGSTIRWADEPPAAPPGAIVAPDRSEEHTSELQSH